MNKKLLSLVLFFISYTALSMQNNHADSIALLYKLLISDEPQNFSASAIQLQQDSSLQQSACSYVALLEQQDTGLESLVAQASSSQDIIAEEQITQQAFPENAKKERLKKKRKLNNNTPIVSCPECQTTLRAVSLKIHLRIHSKEKPYHCLVCNHSYNYISNMVRHLKTMKHKNNVYAETSSHSERQLLQSKITQYKNVCTNCYIAFDYAKEFETHVCQDDSDDKHAEE